MRVAVTGAAGLTGGAVVEALAERGHTVRALVRRDVAVPSAAERLTADVTDPSAMERALADMDGLVHVAGIRLGPDLVRTNGLGRLRRLVVISTAGIHSSHRSSVESYRRGEAALQAALPAVLFVRPTMIYGSRRDRNVHHAIDFARRFRFLPLVGRGAARIQPIHYRDLASAIAELATGPATGVVHAGGAAPVTLDGAAAAIFDALGLARRTVHVPYRLARASAGVAERVLRRRLVERVDRMLEERTVDNARLLELTTTRPRDFAAGVRDQVREMFP